MKGISSPSGGKFFNRGDPLAPDFTQDVLYEEETWTAIDLSGIIPLGTTAVLLSVCVVDNTPELPLKLRTTGNSNEINISEIMSLGLGFYFHRDRIVPTNGLQSIEYHIPVDGLGVIELTVKGWWK